MHEDGVLMPCALAEDETQVQMNRFNPVSHLFEPIALLPAPQGEPTYNHPQFDVSRDGVLALGARTDSPLGYVVFSWDGGVAWTKPLWFADLCACEPKTGALHLYGARFDASGGFHLLLADVVVGPEHMDESKPNYATGARDIFHVMIDSEGNPLHTQHLPTSVETDARFPPSLAAPFGRDDYYVPAFWDHGGAVAWTRDKGIDLTYVVAESYGDGPTS